MIPSKEEVMAYVKSLPKDKRKELESIQAWLDEKKNILYPLIMLQPEKVLLEDAMVLGSLSQEYQEKFNKTLFDFMELIRGMKSIFHEQCMKLNMEETIAKPSEKTGKVEYSQRSGFKDTMSIGEILKRKHS